MLSCFIIAQVPVFRTLFYDCPSSFTHAKSSYLNTERIMSAFSSVWISICIQGQSCLCCISRKCTQCYHHITFNNSLSYLLISSSVHLPHLETKYSDIREIENYAVNRILTTHFWFYCLFFTRVIIEINALARACMYTHAHAHTHTDTQTESGALNYLSET